MLAFALLCAVAAAAGPTHQLSVTPIVGAHFHAQPERPVYYQPRANPRANTIVMVDATWHVDEVFGVDLAGTWFADVSRFPGPITRYQIIDRFGDVGYSDVNGAASAGFSFAPIQGEMSWRARAVGTFAAYTVLGSGLVWTRDDLEALQKEGEPIAGNTEHQVHPALVWALGMRVRFAPVNLRFEVRSRHYIETIESSDLSLERALTVGGGLSFPLARRQAE